MGGFAWVTLATNDSYSLGALVLAHSLKQVGSKHQLAVLVTPGVTNPMRAKLATVFDLVQEVNILDSKDESNLRLLKRPELGVTFTKLHCWRLTQFDKCVFLDADTLVLQNCDELFEREELSAAPDVGWPDCFNSGVFVFRPSNETYDKLVQFAVEKGSFDGGDQGLLNLYFSDWATKDISKHLPFIYNLCSTACYSYLPAFKQFGADAKIIHFIGSSKPWLQYFNTETRKVQPTPDVKHLEAILQQWWNIFCLLIHPTLTPDMPKDRCDNYKARSSSDVTHTKSFRTSPEPKIIIRDPWEEYDLKQSSLPDPSQEQSQSPISEIFEPQIKPVESHNTNADTASHETSSLIPCDNQFEDCDPIPIIETDHVPELLHIEPEPEPEPEPISPVPSIDCEAAAVCEKTLHTPPCGDKTDTGLAGAFAQLTLGAPRTAEQSALDDHLRRQGWEVGNIDYMGRDSFDNIWNKICQTLSAALPEDAPKTTEAPPPSTDAKPIEKSLTEAPAAPQEAAEPPKPQETQPISTECPITPKPKEETPQCPLAAKPKESEVPQIPAAPQPIETPTSQPQIQPQPISTESPQCPITPTPKEETPQCPLAPKPKESEVPQTPAAPQPIATPTPQPQIQPTETPLAPPTPPATAPQCPIALPPKDAAPVVPQTPPAKAAEQPPAPAAPQTPPVPATAPQTPPVGAAEQPPAPVAPQTPPVPAKEQPPTPVVAAEQPPTPVVPQTPPVPAKEQPPTPTAPQPPVEAAKQPPTPTASQAPETAAVAAQTPPVAAPEQPPAPAAPQTPPVPAAAAPQPPPAAAPVVPQTPPVPAKEQPSTPVVAAEQPQTPPVPAKEQPPTPVVAADQPQTPPVPAKEQLPTPAAPQTPPVAAAEQQTPQTAPAAVAQQPPPAAAAPAEAGKGKPESKQSKPETAQGAASVASPTPPPRKGSGGGKKSKSKK
ncbi:proteoglycan 4 isoform X1 [Tribolium castaneum]|uniref:proteoglycan 4 isoform X1 n=1 Tax=Tribolium castaneum TaxID=7070 RepID=UPI00077DEEE4|nr:PREDICTED: proteoglycan 4 isoform X1 [Tribolium castaneum]|eukprot:XP_015838868.1 PREDICTED: proteoglycan 4 isoform X1 [Tribolium castaneum]